MNMNNRFKKLCSIISMALLAALLLIFSKSPSSFAATNTTPSSQKTQSSQAANAVTQSGYTSSSVNVRSAPNTNSTLLTVFPANKHITIYASVTGQAIEDNPIWYRITALNTTAQYIFSGLAVVTTDNGDTSRAPTGGKVIVVSISHQWLHAYQNGVQVFNTPVMTGRPALPSPTGNYHVFLKLSPTTFYSPFPPGSPYWYAPTYIHYALEWHTGGYFLHDGYWHSVFGPGTNMWHYDPVDGWQYGSHGCVAMSIPAAAWLYGWAPYNTLVQINN
jgi:lipoprotein-anchoring transpeptidase ErfK/SrfK